MSGGRPAVPALLGSHPLRHRAASQLVAADVAMMLETLREEGALPPFRRADAVNDRSSVCTLSGRPQVCHYAIAHTARPRGHRTVSRSGSPGFPPGGCYAPVLRAEALACIAAVPAIDTRRRGYIMGLRQREMHWSLGPRTPVIAPGSLVVQTPREVRA